MNDHVKISGPLGRDIASARVFIGLFFLIVLRSLEISVSRDNGFNTNADVRYGIARSVSALHNANKLRLLMKANISR